MLKEMNADIAIIGGSFGGCAAALAAAKRGKRVVMTEETKWIGGQVTNQAVPPDEHRWIEKFGATQSYRQYRNGIRDYYRRNFPLTPAAHHNPMLNPGNGSVSRICHEPRAGLAVLHDMLAPFIHSGKVQIFTRRKPISAETDGDRVISVTVQDLDSQEKFVITAPYFLDATELGDLLPLTGTEYVTGSESKADTGEPHALDGEAQPMDMQAITHCFAIDYIEGEDHTIERPRDYDFWREYQPHFWPGKLLSWVGVHPWTLEAREFGLFEGVSLWRYRRIIDQANFAPGTFDSDISLINWQQNDYWLGSIIDVSEEEKQKHLEGAKQLSLSLLYWLQTEAPRPDGKLGYPGLRLRPDVMGTDDGLAMYPYIRESRRIKAEFTVLEQHVSGESGDRNVGTEFHDSVGIGCYRIDLHPSVGDRHYIDISSLPFQIPLGSLIPIRMKNLIPACKNIGTTHITNGCYRLHPVEWNIGESAAYLAAFCMDKQQSPSQVRNDEAALQEFQQLLVREGIELEWPKVHAI